MGRGRAKAKQTKVARELKYFSPDTDLDALARELRAANSTDRPNGVAEDAGEEDEDYPDYDKWASGDR